jgi:GntR family transcriptional regulator
MTHPGRTEAHPWYGKMTPMQTPPYQQLANDLRAEIEAGTIEAGSWLPAVRKLSETRGVAKGTVAAALEAKPNKGFRVLQSPSPVVLLLDGAGRLRTLDPGRLEVPRTQIEPVSTEVTAALDGTSVGEELLVRRAELLTDGEPYGSNATYFPRAVADRAPGLTDPGTKDIERLLAGLGLVETWHTLELTARSATPDQSRALQVAAGAPLLVLRRLAVGADGPLYLTITSLRPDRIELHTDHPKP